MSRSPKVKAQLYVNLIEAIQEEPRGSVPCVEGDPEKWSGERVPETEVSICDGCPLKVFKKCDHYAQYARVGWGVWANKVYGQNEEA